MEYICVKWHHSSPDKPVLLYSELDGDRWEVRKVEVYADGHVGFAGPGVEHGSTWLGEKPVPPLDDIAADPQFEPRQISRDEFERIWKDRLLVTSSGKGA